MNPYTHTAVYIMIYKLYILYIFIYITIIIIIIIYIYIYIYIYIHEPIHMHTGIYNDWLFM